MSSTPRAVHGGQRPAMPLEHESVQPRPSTPYAAHDLPAQDASIQSRRKPLDDVVHRGQWGAHGTSPS